MKHFIMALAFLLPPIAAGNQENIDDQLVIELTVGELRGIIREIINQTLERCIVEGVMEGQARLPCASLETLGPTLNASSHHVMLQHKSSPMIASPTPVTHNICLSRLFMRREADSSILPLFTL